MRSTNTTDLLELQEWCRKYDRTNAYPSNTLERFLIGMYQLPGYRAWRNSPDNQWESLASCAIHMMVVAEREKAGIEGYLPKDLEMIEKVQWPDEHALGCLCRAAQQLTYGNPRNRTQRAKARFNLGQLAIELACIVADCIGTIPVDQRSKAIENATSIMSGKL